MLKYKYLRLPVINYVCYRNVNQAVPDLQPMPPLYAHHVDIIQKLNLDNRFGFDLNRKRQDIYNAVGNYDEEHD